jgi:hypothetical protein
MRTTFLVTILWLKILTTPATLPDLILPSLGTTRLMTDNSIDS